MQKAINKKQAGFTLIELSIVIVIIGLIVAGVVGGQSLVKQAKLRSVYTEANQYKVAINTFKLEYNQIPGDITNANSYWLGCNSGATPSQCNGDGNKNIYYDIASGHLGIEALRAWQHLNLAELIPGNYTGEADNGSFNTIIGTNAPASKLTGIGWHIRGAGDGPGNIPELNTYANAKNITYLGIGNLRNANNYATDGGGFAPADGYNLDNKFDDGIPDSGNIWTGRGLNHPLNECISGNTLGNLTYNLSTTTESCQIGFPFMN